MQQWIEIHVAENKSCTLTAMQKNSWIYNRRVSQSYYCKFEITPVASPIIELKSGNGGNLPPGTGTTNQVTYLYPLLMIQGNRWKLNTHSNCKVNHSNGNHFWLLSCWSAGAYQLLKLQKLVTESPLSYTCERCRLLQSQQSIVCIKDVNHI